MPIQRRHPVLAIFLIVLLLLAGLGLYGPWPLHIGGRWTPLLTWQGSGTLITKGGEYPLWISFHPSSSSSRLALDGLRPSGGLKGVGCLCLSPGKYQDLTLSGTIFGAWQNTDQSLISLRLHEPMILNTGQRRGYFDLYGRWHGQDLVMEDRGHPGSAFQSNLQIQHASVTLHWSSYMTCRSACASISPPR